MGRDFKKKGSKSGPKQKLRSKSKSNLKKKSKKQETVEEQNKNKLLQKSELLSKSCDEQIQTLKQLHNKILLEPEENIKHLQSMFALVKTPNLKIVCMALRVLAQTFVSIAPLEAIDVKKLDERTEIKIKKEQYKVVKFQKNLVEQYERYIKMLKEMNSKAKLTNFSNDHEIYSQFKKCLLECVIKCYRALWNFNFAKELNELTLKFIKYDACRQFLKEMLMDKNIAMIGIKAKIINGISKLIKQEQNEKRLPSDIIKIINSTYIDSRYLKKDQQSFNYRKKQMKRKLYKQQAFESKKQKQKLKNAEKGSLEMKRLKKEQKMREKMRVKQEVNKQFAEGESIIKNKDLTRHNSNTLQELFYIYFKILVERTNSIFLKDCLDGILKFVHLINIQLTQSLIEHIHASAGVFRQYWKATPTPEFMELRLLIVFTGESIINGPLSVYNMDDAKMTTHLYKIMKDINRFSDDSTDKKKNPKQKPFKITFQVYKNLCLNMSEAFVKRRQLSQQIIGSFIRQLAIFLQRKQIPKMYTIELLRNLGYRYNKVTKMFEQDNEGYGMNSFNPTCEDPQCTNAINTEIVSYLKNVAKNLDNYPTSYQQMLTSKIQKLCKQNFQQKDMAQTLDNILTEELEGGFFQISGSF